MQWNRCVTVPLQCIAVERNKQQRFHYDATTSTYQPVEVGAGILYNKYGNLEYDGEWVDDMKNGTGIEYYPNNEFNSIYNL